MEQSELLKNYSILNNSFKQKMTFHLGAEAGFFSEFNNMVLAILYCLHKKIKFSLYSKTANFALSKGWNDFFLPFCNEKTFFLHSRYNRRGYQIKNKQALPPTILKLITRDNFLTQDIWDDFRNEDFSRTQFHIPELGLNNASLLEATSIIISMIWRYNLTSQKIIKEYRTSIHLPRNYIGMHIRSGDKTLEAQTFSIHHYMEKANELNLPKNAFVLTDNYRVIEQLRNNYRDWKFTTLCSPEEQGYVHSEFNKLDKYQKYLQHLKLFASMDICSAADNYIGTYSSNPGMFMGMRAGEGMCIGVDYDSWILW